MPFWSWMLHRTRLFLCSLKCLWERKDLCHTVSNSQQDVFDQISELSHRILRCHIQPVPARYRAWQVQRAASSEHVASWWRGGGCGIWKRATSKSIGPLFPHAVTSPSCSWNIGTSCQAATNRKLQILPEMYLSIFKEGMGAFGWRTCCSGVWCDLISLNERRPPPQGDAPKLIRCCWTVVLPALKVKSSSSPCESLSHFPNTHKHTTLFPRKHGRTLCFRVHSTHTTNKVHHRGE